VEGEKVRDDEKSLDSSKDNNDNKVGLAEHDSKEVVAARLTRGSIIIRGTRNLLDSR
jgi:hypothetical protein